MFYVSQNDFKKSESSSSSPSDWTSLPDKDMFTHIQGGPRETP